MGGERSAGTGWLLVGVRDVVGSVGVCAGLLQDLGSGGEGEDGVGRCGDEALVRGGDGRRCLERENGDRERVSGEIVVEKKLTVLVCKGKLWVLVTCGFLSER
jgi:hypothetical protein